MEDIVCSRCGVIHLGQTHPLEAMKNKFSVWAAESKNNNSFDRYEYMKQLIFNSGEGTDHSLTSADE